MRPIRWIVIAAVALAAPAAAADPPARPHLALRLDPALVPVNTDGTVDVFLVNAGAGTWTYHFPGGSNGCARPFELHVSDRAGVRYTPEPTGATRKCTEALVSSHDYTLASGESLYVDRITPSMMFRGGRMVALRAGAYTLTVVGRARARLRITRGG